MTNGRVITLEEHFVTESFLRVAGAGRTIAPQLRAFHAKQLDLGAGRIADMDANGIDFQVLSLGDALRLNDLAADTATDLVRDVNDEAAAAMRANPTRLGAFTLLALQDPEKAAMELDRCVRELGFLGAMLIGTHEGKFLDDPRFLPIFEAAAELDVPIYLHPAPPPPPVFDAYFSGLPGSAGEALSRGVWGWHAETGLHTLRLIVAGLFDRLPKLQLIIGHMGEGLPYALARTSSWLTPRAPHLRQPVADYFQSNVHITTSGYFTAPPLLCAREVLGMDRLMYSVDYPFSTNSSGKSYLDGLAGILDAEEMAKLTHRNAEALLKIAAA
jgi:uncharacterized protein